MNKMKLLVLATALIVGIPSIAGALQTSNVEVAKDVNQDTAVQVREVGAAAVDSVTELMDRYMTNFRTCEPLHISQSIDIFGLKAFYQFDINGWVDNKCSYYMTGNIGGLGKDIRDVFKIKATDEDIAKIKPIVQCNFNQEQLDILVDGFIATQERKLNEKVMPISEKSSTKKKLSPAEEKMMEMLMGGQVCTVPNQEQLMQDFSKLMGLPSPMAAPSCDSPETQSPEAVDEPAVEVSEPQAPVEQEVAPEVVEEVAPQAPEVVEPVTEPAAEVEKPVLRKEQGPKMNMPQAPKF